MNTAIDIGLELKVSSKKDYIENEYREKELKKLQDLIEDKERFFKVADEMYKKYME